MKRKLLILSILTTLILSMTGCQKKVAYSTGDKEVDAEIQQILEEEESIDESEEIDSNDPTYIEILESYMVTRDNFDYLVIKINKPNSSDDFTGLKFIGECDDEEKVLYDNGLNIALLGEDDLLGNPYKVNANEKYIVFKLKWSGYDTYYLNIDLPVSSYSSEYEIDSSEIEKLSYDEFTKVCYDEIFDSATKNKSNLGDIEISYIDSNFTDSEMSLKLNFKNTGSVPSDKDFLSIRLVSKDYKSSYLANTVKIPALNPDEEFTLDLSEQIPSKLASSSIELSKGTEYILEIKDESDVFYRKLSGAYIEYKY